MLIQFTTFILVVLINIFYTYFLKAVENNNVLKASIWSALINLSASVAAINYINDHWNLVPSCLGSFVGTFLGLKLQKKYETK
jgi:hypothetical protein